MFKMDLVEFGSITMDVFEYTRSPLSLSAQIPFYCLISKQELLLLVLKG